MSVGWRDLTLMKKQKKECKYLCQECGSDKNIQAHHSNGKDNNSLEVLCGKSHSKRHPELSVALFVNKRVPHPRQLWLFKIDTRGRPSSGYEIGDYVLFPKEKLIFKYEYDKDGKLQKNTTYEYAKKKRNIQEATIIPLFV